MSVTPVPRDEPDPSLTEEERHVTTPPMGDVPATDDSEDPVGP